MKKILQLTLGIVTSIGGFLEVGSITTAAQGGAEFGYRLAWSILLGTICLIFLVEMSGRLAAVAKQTIVDAIRERFGFSFFMVLLAFMTIVSYLVLSSELGGVSLALQIATGVSYRWWALPVAFVGWLLIWRGTFSIIENGTSLLGLVTIVFAVAAFKLHPDWHATAIALAPSLPPHDSARYWFLVVSILGASITPSLMFFYSSGAIEDKWDASFVGANRAVATIGMAFGGALSIAVLLVAALVFHSRGIRIDTFEQMALLLSTPLARTGFILFIVALAVACLGAALEIKLALAYMFAQGFGWAWGEDLAPRDDARFATVYTVVAILAPVPLILGVDPLKLTVMSMALTAATLPLAIVPFLFVMNDKRRLGEYTNGWVGNSVVVLIIVMASVLAFITIPLEIIGGG